MPEPYIIPIRSTQQQIRKNLRHIIFYRVSTTESALVRYISARDPIGSPVGVACSKLEIIGKTFVSKPIYDARNSKFQIEKSKFLHAGKFNRESFSVSKHTLGEMLKQIGEPLELSTSQKGALRLIVKRLNDKHIAEM